MEPELKRVVNAQCGTNNRNVVVILRRYAWCKYVESATVDYGVMHHVSCIRAKKHIRKIRKMDRYILLLQ